MPGEWLVVHRDKTFVPLGDFKPQNLHFEIRNSDEGPCSYELSLADPFLTRDCFAPWKTSYFIFRVNPVNGASNLLTSGIHLGRNLNNERDTVLAEGASWERYFKHRIFPFDASYVEDRNWTEWPKMWPDPTPPGDPSNPDPDLMEIVCGELPHGTGKPGILQAMMDEDGINAPSFVLANKMTGKTGRYKIYPADQTTIYEHIRAISEQGPEYGFEFAVDPLTLEFKMFYPNRDSGVPVYRFRVTEDAVTGEIKAVDWTDNGPMATWTLGLGNGTDKGIRLAGVDSYTPPGGFREFFRTDQVIDFGNVSDQAMIDRLTSTEGFYARFQEKKLNLTIVTPELLSPNFYTGGRPQNLIGNRINFRYDFGYHLISADYRVMALIFDVDNHGNEEVTFELEQINA